MNTDWHAHLTVATIIEKSGKYLMVEEISDGAEVINQPAGHLEQKETLTEAAIRETLEETGWHVRIDNIVGFYLHTSCLNNITYFRCCFAATAVEYDENYPLDEGIIGPSWMSIEDLKTQKNKLRSPLVIKCIEDYISGERLPLSCISNS